MDSSAVRFNVIEPEQVLILPFLFFCRGGVASSMTSQDCSTKEPRSPERSKQYLAHRPQVSDLLPTPTPLQNFKVCVTELFRNLQWLILPAVCGSPQGNLPCDLRIPCPDFLSLAISFLNLTQPLLRLSVPPLPESLPWGLQLGIFSHVSF